MLHTRKAIATGAYLLPKIAYHEVMWIRHLEFLAYIMASSSHMDSICATMEKGEYEMEQELLKEYLQSKPDSSEALDLLEQINAQLPSDDNSDLGVSSASASPPKASR